MRERAPSCTAIAAAVYLAPRQVPEDGRIFKDQLAVKVLGADPDVIGITPRPLTWAARQVFDQQREGRTPSNLAVFLRSPMSG